MSKSNHFHFPAYTVFPSLEFPHKWRLSLCLGLIEGEYYDSKEAAIEAGRILSEEIYEAVKEAREQSPERGH